ncbi:arsenical-resistance protein ACR3 [Dacryopinax primogenitus]|uniref:Arsenical-resistance protein ACR3 n=1 Tax=Dacryopinax primogenitus (strain DJM 731) TaxID=1858805 RepID=M5G0V5_DACPD|nr:arsenical-resistance protein ACR3 [Dacryopinax primogenitus]EJU03881.1 arsenical-resistance protein ACR3 [Dacryopinax primogenitus]
MRPSCRNCDFCDGLASMDPDTSLAAGTEEQEKGVDVKSLFKGLGFLDRYLALFVFLAMVLGVLLGVYREDDVHRAFGGAQWQGASIPILIGLLIMIWPILTKVSYESLPALFSTRRIWIHLGLSALLNWVVAPFVMLGLAWATMPEPALERERKGVILVGVARCIAMVLIWNGLACGDTQYCAILVGVNSVLQIVLFAPYALLFLNVLGGSSSPALILSYSSVATSVGIYLGIPLAAGILTRFIIKTMLSSKHQDLFFHYFSPLSLLGLLYTIIVLFAAQGQQIAANVGSVFRIFVPLILYFTIVWNCTFFGLYFLGRSRRGRALGGYDKAVVQAFTAGSSNFELAIAVAVASFGTESPEALAATIGPLVEVPVLLALSCVALLLRKKLDWTPKPNIVLV